ncbi:MAG: tetratricopeptide repeat protein [bacterium]
MHEIQPASKNWILVLVVFLIGFVLYANTISHGYVLDDYGVLSKNRIVTQGVKGIPTLLSTPYRFGVNALTNKIYRPLSQVMFAVEWQIAPDKPWVSHLINVFFYALTCALLLLVLRKVFTPLNPLLSLLICLLWITHPVHTEVVANIKSRDEIMALLFILLTFLGLFDYLKRSRVLSLVGAGFAYFLAFFSKESVITLVVIFPLAGWYFSDAKLKKNLIAAFTLAIPALIFLFIRAIIINTYAISSTVPVVENLLSAAPDFSTRTATAIYILGKYLLVLLFPYQLVCDCGYNQIPIMGWNSPGPWLSFLVYGGALIYALINFRKRNLLVFGILFYLVTMSIASNLFILIGTSYGERLLYPPSIGFCIVLGILLSYLGKRKSESMEGNGMTLTWTRHPVMFIIAGVILFLYSYKTVIRNAEWKDEWTLFSSDVKRSPNSSRTHFYWGRALSERAKEKKGLPAYDSLLQLSVDEYKSSIAIYPSFPDCHLELGASYFNLGQSDSALKYYEQSNKLNPTVALPYENMGILWFHRGDYEKSRELFEKAISIDPYFTDAHFNLGSTYGALGQYEKAIQHFKQTISLDSMNVLAYYNVAIAYKFLNQEDLAEPFFTKAQKLDPTLKK